MNKDGMRCQAQLLPTQLAAPGRIKEHNILTFANKHNIQSLQHVDTKEHCVGSKNQNQNTFPSTNLKREMCVDVNLARAAGREKTKKRSLRSRLRFERKRNFEDFC